MLTGASIATGYASRAYAESLSEFGELIHLPRCGGYLLKRNIPGTDEFDAMGCYPLFLCNDWSALKEDLSYLPNDIVSASIVADPYGDYSQEQLEDCFDIVNPFKKHYVADLSVSPASIGSRHHRKMARSALKKMEISVCENPAQFAGQWTLLYETLMERHQINGIRAFSKNAFSQQLSMPEIVVHQAICEDELVGAQLFFPQGDVVHCHLGAVSEQGYKLGAFYALDQFSFEYFSGKTRMLDIGGGAGLACADNDGLSRYKKGWCSDTRPVYFCGRITNSERYEALVSGCGQEESSYFPAYRAGEFG